MHKDATRFTLRALLATIASLSLLCVTASVALAAPAQPGIPAHAKVAKSDPAIGSTIAQAPTKVTVFALEEINPDPTKSNLQVYGPGADATDTLISQGTSQVSLSDPKQMSVNITPNSGHTNGVYIVFWKTVSADDGDEAAGSFSFTVGATAPTTPSKPTAPVTTQQPAGSSSAGTPMWVPIVAALIALLVGVGVGLVLGRRKPAPSSFAATRSSLTQERKEEAEKRL